VNLKHRTWSLDFWKSRFKTGLKKAKQPKDIIAVHLYGMQANMAEIMNIANLYEIPVIEDEAEALGSC
jgi:dTDP-4-amino-4,6-dideoxygalactose transaminase